MHTPRSRPRPLTLAALLTLAVGSSVSADLLEIDSSTLTTYLYASATAGQNVRPLVRQRGVLLDGSARAPSALGWALQADPQGEAWNAHRRLGDIDLATGAYGPTEVHLALPAPGFPLVFGTSYNGNQQTTAPAAHSSNGYMGVNRFQIAQPEVVLYDDPTSDANDVLYLVYGADRFLEFRRSGTGSSDFKSKNGAAGAVRFAAGAASEPDTYSYYDGHGNVTVFFGFDGDAGSAAGQFWKMSDPAGNVAYVGDAATGSTAISSGYDGSRIEVLYDTAGRRYTCTYATIGLVPRLTQILAETDENGGGWGTAGTEKEVGKVQYAYYQSGDTTHGGAGTLKQVTLTTPLSDTGVNLVEKTYYRYWTGAYNASTNPGHANTLKMVVQAAGVQAYDWLDSTLDDDHFTASTDTLKPYAAAYLEYEADTTTRRVSSAFFNGECGCAGGANGTYTFTYEANGSFSGTSGYDTAWHTRTIVERPDNTFLAQHFDEAAQPLSMVITDADPAGSPTKTWATAVTRDAASGTSPGGLITQIATPAAVSGYTHSTGAITLKSGSGDVGLVHRFVRQTSGTFKGLLLDRMFKEDAGYTDPMTGETVYYDRSQTHASTSTLSMTVGTLTVERPVVASTKSYTEQSTSSAAEAQSLTMATTAGSGAASLMVSKLVTTYPAVATLKNGANATHTTETHVRADGTVSFTKDRDGTIEYREYTGGLLTKLIRDADTTKTSAGQDFDGVTIPSGLASTAGALHLKTVYTYDRQGRLDTTTTYQAGGTTARRAMKMYYSVLADGRMVTVSIPRFTTGGSTTYFGPAGYTVSNPAGQAEMSGTIAITSSGITTALSGWINEGASDPILALQVGTLARMSTRIHDESGTKLEESRAYFDIPASGAGADGTNYDATLYGYDAMGRRWRVQAPHGTITRTVFDELGRATESWTGTNDSSFSGGAATGTDTMTKTSVTEYDDGNDGGNSYVTEVRLDPDGDWNTAGDQRVTTYHNDARGRAIATERSLASHTLVKLDNMGRTLAVGHYSVTGLDEDDDPTSLATNRVALSQTFYDERGMVWKTQRHKIDPADGSDDDTLQTLSWYDPDGRLIKQDGEQLAKTAYDRLGRATHRFTLATDNDSAYADADDVSGDVVLEEHQSLYEPDTGNVLMTATIRRHASDLANGTTGALDSNADADARLYTMANIAGRISIGVTLYDDLDRPTLRAEYGTNGGTNFDLDLIGTPGRSDTVLVTSYVYNDDGTVQDVTDPKGLVTRTLYDDLGRAIATIANYVNGTPSSATGDDDVYTRFTYTDGLRTEHWVDIDGDGAKDVGVDQVTTYTHGTTKGVSAGDSQVARGDLLQKITYPDSSGATDVVSFAYNALGQQVWKKDQIGTVIETDFDTVGRKTHERVTTLGTGVDGAVLRNSLTYNSRGMVETITQYTHATVGSGTVTDQVKYSYDEWMNLSLLEQDHDSAVSGGGNDWDVAYAYAKATTGRNTLRLSTQTLPDAFELAFYYNSTGNLLDDAASRVTSIGGTVSGGSEVTLAEYEYLGLGTLVRTDLPEPGVYSTRWHDNGAGTITYPAWDTFGRVEDDTWTKDLATDRDFFDLDIAYDRNGNVTGVTDTVHTSAAGNRTLDVLYTMDGLNRVTDADKGTLSAGAIANRTGRQQWTLTQPGAITRDKVDLNGDGDWGDANELDDSRTFNLVNELTARDTDSNGVTNYSPTYDAAGNLTDDAQHYEYTYDAWQRLVKVKSTSFSNVIAEYRYNGLGWRITWKYDTNANGTVGAGDMLYHLVYDRWRQVATYRNNAGTIDATPKERFVYHAAGLGGGGGSSYIDSVILRDRDNSSGWTGAADGLDTRNYYGQNWRGDVSVLLTDTGKLVEWVKYSAYGVPDALPAGDADADRDWDAVDSAEITDGDAYEVAQDADLDGDNDAADATHASSITGGFRTLGWGILSSSAVGNRKGYAGYEHAPELSGTKWHARHRVLDSVTGAWLSRDLVGYHDSMDLYSYVAGRVVVGRDPMGLMMVVAPGLGTGCPGGINGPGRGTCGGGGGGGGNCAPGWRYDPVRDACVMVDHPWDCAADSASYAECYACCNRDPGDWGFQSSCYRYCDRRYRPPGNWPPFLPNSGPGGPCFRESGGHPACTGTCPGAQDDINGDGIQIHWRTPSGELVLVCCICDISNPQVSGCGDVADCVTERFECFAFSDPSVSLACRSVECIGRQVECLRGKLATTNEACRQQLLDALQYWGDELERQQAICANENGTPNH